MADHLWYRAPTSLSSLSAVMASNASNASQIFEKTLVPKRIWTYPTFIYIYICIHILENSTKKHIEQMPGRFLKLQLLPKENHRFRFWILSHCHSFRWISTWSIWPEKPRLGIVSRVNPFGERTVLGNHWTSRTVNAFGFKRFKWFKIFKIFKIFNHHLS